MAQEKALPSDTASNGTLNKLRAAVLGANDGIVSISSVVMGIAGAGAESGVIFMAGLAALVAGALSMAVGEYVSVSSQSDAEKAFIKDEKDELAEDPEGELDELAREYMKQGVSEKTARLVAAELTEKDALRAHLRMHFGLDPDDINSPMQAAVSSLIAFTIGGLIPFLTIVLVPAEFRIIATIASVVLALFVVGYMSAKVGGASRGRAMVRVLFGGIAAMVLTYYVGVLFGTSVL
ncbi:MAG: VIT family protein [Candidatus Saccharimonadaceae bacterium]